MGYNVIKVTNEEQLNYMINFLNIGNFEILAVNPGLEAKIAGRTVRDVKVTYVDFSGIM
jgi:N-dimethylarginine dimethylaminohydrolase